MQVYVLTLTFQHTLTLTFSEVARSRTQLFSVRRVAFGQARRALTYVMVCFVECPLLMRARLQLSQEEQNAIIGLHSKPDLAQANGFRLAGDKYFTLQANERSIYGKKQVCHLCCLPI